MRSELIKADYAIWWTTTKLEGARIAWHYPAVRQSWRNKYWTTDYEEYVAEATARRTQFQEKKE